MPRKGQKKSGGRRRLGAVAAATNALSYVPVAINAGKRAYGMYKTAKSVYNRLASFKGRPRPSFGSKAPKTFKIMRSGDSGYISPHIVRVGTPKTSLSMNDRVQRMVNPPQSFSWTQDGKIESSSGQQGVSGFIVNNSYLNQICGEYPNLRTESAVADPQVLNSSPNNRVNHHKTEVSYTFMNSSNITAELEIYTYRCNMDVDSTDQFATPSASWSYAEQINNLNANTIDGASGTTLLAKRPIDRSVVGIIGRYWGAIDKARIYLKPGESVKHNLTQHVNRVMSLYMLNADTNAVIKHHAIGYIFVLRGQLVGSSLTSQVSTGDAQISFIRNVKISFSTYSQNRARDVVITNSIGNIGSVQQVVINTDTSAQTTGYVEDA